MASLVPFLSSWANLETIAAIARQWSRSHRPDHSGVLFSGCMTPTTAGPGMLLDKDKDPTVESNLPSLRLKRKRGERLCGQRILRTWSCLPRYLCLLRRYQVLLLSPSSIYGSNDDGGGCYLSPMTPSSTAKQWRAAERARTDRAKESTLRQLQLQ